MDIITYQKAKEAQYYKGAQKLRGQLITKANPNIIASLFARSSERRPMWTITYDDDSNTIYENAFPYHQSENVPGVFYVIPSRIGTGQLNTWGVSETWERLLEMDRATTGRIEIQHHTYQHLDVTTLNNDALRDDLENANELFIAHGIFPSHFAYPGGGNNARTRNVLQDYFESATTTEDGHNIFNLHPMKIKRKSSDAITLAVYKDAIDKAVQGNGWLITYQHAIHPSGLSNGQICQTPATMIELIQYAKSKGVEIVGLDEGLRTFAPFFYSFKESKDLMFSLRRDGKMMTDKQTSVVSDTFNRTDNASSLGSTETGQAWSVVGNGTWGIIGNQAYCTTNTGVSRALVSSGYSNCQIDVDLSITEGTEAQLVFRHVDANNEWSLRPSSTRYELWKKVAGVSTMVRFTTGITPKNNDHVQIVLDDTNFMVLVNNTKIIDICDQDLITGTKHGLFSNFANIPRWDNFSVKSLYS